MTEAELLYALIPAIYAAHGYCPICSGKFIRDANKILERTDCNFRYWEDTKGKWGDRIKVITKDAYREKTKSQV